MDLEWVQAVRAVCCAVNVHVLTGQDGRVVVLDVDVLLKLTDVAA